MGNHRLLFAALGAAMVCVDLELPAYAQRRPSPWFVDHQADDGSWPAKSFPKVCPQGESCVGGGGASDADTPATTAAVLMMLTSIGHSRQVGPFAVQMKRGINFLVSKQDKRGRVGDESPGGRHLYNQALSVMALAEAYGTGGKPAELKPAIQKAVDYLIAKQREDGGWPYGPDPKRGDAPLTVWSLFALRSAKLAGFVVPEARTTKAFGWLETARDSDGLVGWRGMGDVGERPTGCRWITSRAALRAGVAAARLLYGFGRADRVSAETAAWLTKHKPKVEAPDAMLAYFGTLVMFQMGGTHWTAWQPALDTAVMRRPRRDGPPCAHWTWDPAKDLFGEEGGRTYTSAFNMIATTIARRYRAPKNNPKGPKKG